jgi:hypothetical protein
VASPLVHYVATVVGGGNGNAYLFLLLVLLAPIAGLILIANSLFCLFQYRHRQSFWFGFVFLLVGVIGLLEAWYFLPQFRM